MCVLQISLTHTATIMVRATPYSNRVMTQADQIRPLNRIPETRRGKKQGQKWHCFFYVDLLYFSSGPGFSVLNDRGIRLHPIPAGDPEVSCFAGGAFTEAI